MVSDGKSGSGIERKVCLDLFAGLGGFSAAFKEADDWEVYTVDLEARFDPDLQADVLDLRPEALLALIGEWDILVVLASPPCTDFSLAASRYERFKDGEPQTDSARESVALVYHTLGLIHALSPDYWVLENPQGYLRQVIGEPTGRVTYCQYGLNWMKPTDLWGEHPAGLSYRACSYGDDCHNNNTDQAHGGQGNARDAWKDDMGDKVRDPAERAKVPYELSESILDAVESDVENPAPEQSELPIVTDGGSVEPSDVTEQFRKRAPGHAKDHPDWIFSLSGGVDSVAATIVAIKALRSSDRDGNFAKAPVAIYLDTRTGAPLNRLYVEQFCDWLDVQLWTLRTDEKFENWLRRDGAPGSGAHQEVRNELKDRQVSKMTTMADDPVYVLGISADESETRAKFSKVRQMRRHTEVYPVHRLTRKERVEIVLRSGCPINPLWLYPSAIADCGCLCNGDPSELDKTAELFPVFAQRLREWEEAITHDFPKDTLGWGGLTADEEAALRDGYEQSTLPMCAEGCQRERDPAEVRAFEARAKGASAEQALSILHESSSLEVVA